MENERVIKRVTTEKHAFVHRFEIHRLGKTKEFWSETGTDHRSSKNLLPLM